MRNLKSYWDEIREIRSGLPEFVWLVAAGGSLVQAGSGVAARLLKAKTHRLATEDEVRVHRDQECAWNRQQTEQRLRREGVVVIAI
ncbi:MAG TPA: hypothetical protein VKR43_13465 [Bryobacteraceae bacterium]|nr:hypothetical protein [Bryobacteraceae bacterium]